MLEAPSVTAIKFDTSITNAPPSSRALERRPLTIGGVFSHSPTRTGQFTAFDTRPNLGSDQSSSSVQPYLTRVNRLTAPSLSSQDRRKRNVSYPNDLLWGEVSQSSSRPNLSVSSRSALGSRDFAKGNFARERSYSSSQPLSVSRTQEMNSSVGTVVALERVLEGPCEHEARCISASADKRSVPDVQNT